MDRGSAAKIGGMDRQTLRDWVHCFNGSGLESLVDNWTEDPKAPRPFRRRNEGSSRRSSRRVKHRELGSVVRFRQAHDLKCGIAELFDVDFHPRYVGKLLPKLRLLLLSAQPRHPAQDERTVAAFPHFPCPLKAHLDGVPETTPVEIWFEDEARIGQKNGQVRQWARRGTRPRQPADQRYDNAYLFGGGCPARVSGGPRAPYADVDTMQLHLEKISSNDIVRPTLWRPRPGRMAHDRASSMCPTTSRRSSCLPAPRS